MSLRQSCSIRSVRDMHSISVHDCIRDSIRMLILRAHNMLVLRSTVQYACVPVWLHTTINRHVSWSTPVLYGTSNRRCTRVLEYRFVPCTVQKHTRIEQPQQGTLLRKGIRKVIGLSWDNIRHTSSYEMPNQEESCTHTFTSHTYSEYKERESQNCGFGGALQSCDCGTIVTPVMPRTVSERYFSSSIINFQFSDTNGNKKFSLIHRGNQVKIGFDEVLEWPSTTTRCTYWS